ncbi:MAG TPA: hypothetical protein DF383_13385 [Deltaproteobacteria bacterium]|nr:hypothetical protein [Deltaproteobacteria bacterium]
MGTTPNRLETHWPLLRSRILQEWKRLSADDLDRTGMQFDQLVHLIRTRYGGRVEIIQEAAIRDALNRILQEIET